MILLSTVLRRKISLHRLVATTMAAKKSSLVAEVVVVVQFCRQREEGDKVFI